MNRTIGAGPGIMLLSAAIFGFFGFTTSWIYYSGTTGQFLFFVALLDWTLKGAAIGFLICGLITFFAPVAGNALYCIVSMLSAVSFLIVAILDIADTQHIAIHPLLLIIFAGWNGYGAWMGISELVARRQSGDTGPPTAASVR
ncbi:MAG: hypothetical protein L0Y42_15045 [Phycisphaerales bacterium]|nr:hypothetical protein [Phycisphaerales bacterium]